MTGTVVGGTRATSGGDGPEVALELVPPVGTLREAVLALAPHPHQRRYSGIPAETLPPSERDPGQWPVAIVADGVVAGFFVLHGGVSAGRFVRPSGELLLRALFVAADAQGRGIATAALARLPPLVSRLDPSVRRIVLTVNVENEIALRTYRRVGFVATGERYQRPGGGPQHVMQLLL